MLKHLTRLPLLALAACAFAAPALAQINIKGRVLERANLEPVANALVAIEGAPQSVRTDANGVFTLTGNSALRPGGRGYSPASLPERPSLNGSFLELPSRWAAFQMRIETFDAKGALRGMRMAARSSSDPNAPLESGALGKTAAAALVRVAFTADLLTKKTLDVRADTGDIGNVILDYPPRRVDTGAPPIYGAARLFDGTLDSAGSRAQMEANWMMWVGPSRKARGLGATPVVWKILRDPEVPSRWTFSECCGVPAGGPEWGYDDLVTKAKFNDYQLHIEFNLMGTPGDENPSGSCNSGVYQQNRYELQIETIPNPWDPNNNHGMGSIINEYPPPANLSRPQGKWQAYDITFRNDRYIAGRRTEFARTTIFWNGKLIHDNRKIAGAIACCDAGNVPMDSTVQGLKLQNEKGSDVRFRNVWIKPLTIKDTLTNFGY
jgi:hypothetical protein